MPTVKETIDDTLTLCPMAQGDEEDHCQCPNCNGSSYVCLTCEECEANERHSPIRNCSMFSPKEVE